MAEELRDLLRSLPGLGGLVLKARGTTPEVPGLSTEAGPVDTLLGLSWPVETAGLGAGAAAVLSDARVDAGGARSGIFGGVLRFPASQLFL